MSDLKQKKQPGSLMGGIYSLFSILIPGLFSAGLDSVLRDIIPFLVIVPWWFIFIVLACTIVVSRVLLLLTKRIEIPSLVRIVFFIYFPAICIMIFFLYQNPRLMIYVLLLLFIQWSISFFIFNRFKEYLEFIKLVRNHPGHSLLAEIHTHSLSIQNSYASLQKVKKVIHRIQFLLFAFITILFLLDFQLSFFSLFISAVSIISGLVFGITVNTCLDEYRFYIDGISIGDTLKQKRLAHVLIVLLLGLFLVIPFLRNSSVFSPGDITRVFRWLSTLFPAIDNPEVTIPDYYQQDNRDWTEFLEFLQQDQDTRSVINLTLILEISGIAIACLLAAGLLYFLLKPLLIKGLIPLFKGKRPLREIIKILMRVAFFLRNLTQEFTRSILSLFRSPVKKHDPVSREIKIDPRLLPKKLSLKKKIQKNRVLKAFFVLVKWGMKQKINFHPTLGPKEYVCFIIEKIPEKKDVLEFIADTFEEAVFSDHIMHAVTIKRYIRAIRTIKTTNAFINLGGKGST